MGRFRLRYNARIGRANRRFERNDPAFTLVTDRRRVDAPTVRIVGTIELHGDGPHIAVKVIDGTVYGPDITVQIQKGDEHGNGRTVPEAAQNSALPRTSRDTGKVCGGCRECEG